MINDKIKRGSLRGEYIMDDVKVQIPFVLNDRQGLVEVIYKENKSEKELGFDLLKGLGFDVAMCIGYPTMHGYIKEYAGTGYSNLSAWIQIISSEYYSSLGDEVPSEVLSEVDISDNMRKLGVPFFAFGYPSEIYDAPCNNLGNFARLKWVADTFLVTHPSRINDNMISFVIGFRWGYEEWEAEGKRNIRMLPLEIIERSVWEKHLLKIRKDFPDWNFK